MKSMIHAVTRDNVELIFCGIARGHVDVCGPCSHGKPGEIS